MSTPSQTSEAAGWAQRLLRTRGADLLLRKSADATFLYPLQRWYFPLSRLWAAANESEGQVERFRQAIAGNARVGGRFAKSVAGNILAANERARLRMLRARERWESAAFDQAGFDSDSFGKLEASRRRAATLHLATRSLFYPMLFPVRPSPARWQIPSAQLVDLHWGQALANPQQLFAGVPMTSDIARSPIVRSGATQESWLRFATPSLRLRARAETQWCYARVIEPVDGDSVPTLIAGSGLCLETDLVWPAGLDTAKLTQRLGLRIVDVVSPYHGLRAWRDRYGGEPFFATAPLGTLDLVLGQTLETAILTAWCRAQFAGPVAVGGISMSSFVAQQVASRCDLWPAEMRPDAVLLVSHTGDMAAATLGSDLVRSLGLDRELSRHGWDSAALARLAPLLDPTPSPAIAPERIVSALGTSDRVLPYGGGAELARSWKLPPANVFHYPIGHMVMPLGLIRDDAPLRRIRQILTDR